MRRALVALGVILAAGALGWAMFWWLPGIISPQQATRGGAAVADAPAGGGRTIRATLFYANENGDGLVGVEREVPQADDTAEQARNILDRQLEPAPAPLLQVVPEATPRPDGVPDHGRHGVRRPDRRSRRARTRAARSTSCSPSTPSSTP